ncbi:phosphotransferase enzyme family protein [Aneurinibacillus aneurinilyticus]|uniref:phosphotransferase enzyme family protein n=1 Tax=Aneurinibacillus aneurinilyticus TaxID=1391 RepID=UPI0023F497E0|nr:phosphotransferase [Aneurinibacillus aneurinilyticus]
MLAKIQEYFQILPFVRTDLIQHVDEEDDVRIIYKATTADGQAFAVRILSNSYTTKEDLVGQARLCKMFSQAGLSVPKRLYKEDTLPYMTLSWKGQEAFAVVEEWMPGRELEHLDINLIGQAGEWLGKMHHIATETIIHFSSESPWSMFGSNDELAQDAHTLKVALQKSGANRTLYEELYALYEKKRKKLKERWSQLPCGAVQGDFSLNNLFVDDDGNLCNVIDFHLAGTDVFVGHFAGEGAFLSYAAERVDDDSEKMGDIYFNAFMAGYKRNRQLSQQEQDILNDLIGLRRAFACYQVDDVLHRIEIGDIHQVNVELEKMLFYMKKQLII